MNFQAEDEKVVGVQQAVGVQEAVGEKEPVGVHSEDAQAG